MKASTSKKLLIAAVAALSTVVVAGTTAFAVYTNHQLNASNTITVGTEVETITITGGEDYAGPLYPGDTATFEYTVAISEGVSGVTAEWALAANGGTNFAENDFTVTVTNNGAPVTENTTEITDGTLTVTVKFTSTELDVNKGAKVPDYTGLTLTIELIPQA